MPEATLKPSSVNEIWGSVVGSYEADQRLVSDAVRSSSLFGPVENEWELSVIATFADHVVVENDSFTPNKSYSADWSKDEVGDVVFSNVKEVKAEVVVKAIGEQKGLLEAIRERTGTKSFDETIRTPITLIDINEGTGKDPVYVAKVKIAQRADVQNNNRRVYPEKVLHEAVTNLQSRMSKTGPRPMEECHNIETDGNGVTRNQRQLTRTASLIHELGWNDKEKTVSLDDIRFIGTDAGKNMLALIEGGYQPEVSQRAHGTSKFVKDESTGTAKEIVTSLFLDSWDWVPAGEAGVSEATVDFEVLTEVTDMPDKKVLDEEEVGTAIDSKLDGVEDRIATKVTTSILESLNDTGEDEEPKPKPDDTATPKDETVADTKPKPDDKPADKPEPKDKPDPEPKPDDTTTITESDAAIQGVRTDVDGVRKDLDESREMVEGLKKDKALTHLATAVPKILSEVLKGEDYKRFNDAQKALIVTNVKPASLYGTIDVYDEAKVKEALAPMLTEQVAYQDTAIAATKLETTGYPIRGSGGQSIAHVEVLHENIPNMEYMMKLEGAIDERLDKGSGKSKIVIGDNHELMPKLNEILAMYDAKNWGRLQNEANEEVTQTDIGANRIASIDRVIIRASFRRLTALEFCDVGTMLTRIDDVMVESWNPAETGDIADDMASIEIAEGGNIPTAGVQYTPVPVFATRKALRTRITSEAIATSRNTPMNAEADAVSGLVRDIQRRVDRLLWQLMITQSLAVSTTEVSAYETLTQVGATNEWSSLFEGWMQYELLKTVDGNLNPTGSKLGQLFDTPAGNVLQAVDVREAGGDNTALIYTTDYTVNWPDGTITLTAAGVIKEAGNNVEAKYTYSTNLQTWSKIPPSGVTLYQHLINLRNEVGNAMTVIQEANYDPDFMGTNVQLHNTITSGPQFTEAGRTPADALSRLNQVLNYSGLEPVMTTAIPNAWVVVGVKGATVYRIHTPWNMTGPIVNAATGERVFISEEYSAYEVPVKEKLHVVGITNLKTAV